MAEAGPTHDKWMALHWQGGEAGALKDLKAGMERPLLLYSREVLTRVRTAAKIVAPYSKCPISEVHSVIRMTLRPSSIYRPCYHLSH